ncbi:TlpA family protein disulfide reductase [Schaalia sp. 19OD2882]|uniref:TlpA family protein disulfide reductase n=1 Tax=Schaalia sp. 19OD2882 TaxID=2794089 RepID=UPI001C1E9025|nr:TlpA disulfide reductase family protein [Schaalia sp. 19OD2882]QWW18892.1 TlpA family protein disulfide reductase [Schaalia sp. 19OD2882]
MRNSAWVRNTLVLAVTTAVVLGGVWLAQSVRSGGPAQSGRAQTQVSGQGVSLAAPAVGDKAPTFTATTLEGTPIDTAKLDGKPLWLLFNATWCTDCRVEAPDIQAVHAAHGDKVRIVAVHVNDDPDTVKKWVSTLGLGYTHVVDKDGVISRAWGVDGIPAHWFVGADGVIVDSRVGALSPAQMERKVAELLK